MLRRLLLLDILLLILIVAGGLKVRRSWLEFESSHRVETVQAEPEIPRQVPTTSPAAAAVGDWTEIVSKNPFSFDRNDIAILAPKETAPAVPKGPKPLLFGTMGIGKDWTAMLASSQSGNRKPRPLKVGDTIDNWQVVDINERSVVITFGDVRETVLLNDQLPRTYDRTVVSGTAAVVPVQTQTVTTSASTTATGAPTATPPPPPPPTPTPGQGKGRYIYTPFSNNPVWVPEQ